MRYVFTTLVISMILVGCSVEEMNVHGENSGDIGTEKSGDEATPDTQPDNESIVVHTSTTTTTTVTTTGSARKDRTNSRQVVATYKLVNDNPDNTEFVSDNYCDGALLRDCWIRSAYLFEYQDGTFKASIEFWDSYEEQPYSIEKDVIDTDRAFLISEEVNIYDDETNDFKFLWAVVNLDDLSLDVVYDWGKDGPGLQGDDLLDTYYFVEVTQ